MHFFRIPCAFLALRTARTRRIENYLPWDRTWLEVLCVQFIKISTDIDYVLCLICICPIRVCFCFFFPLKRFFHSRKDERETEPVFSRIDSRSKEDPDHLHAVYCTVSGSFVSGYLSTASKSSLYYCCLPKLPPQFMQPRSNLLPIK